MRTRGQRTVIIVCAFLALAVSAGPGCKSEEKPLKNKLMIEAGKPAANSEAPYYYGLIEEYRTVVAEDPRNLAAITALGNAFYDLGQWKEAIRYYEQALQLNPHNADVLTDMGTCYRNLGNADRAISLYKRALAVDPLHVNALYNMGVVYGHDKQAYATAIDYWDRLLRTAPNHPRAEYLRISIANFKKLQKGKKNQ